MNPLWLKAKYRLCGPFRVRLFNGQLVLVTGFRWASFGPAVRLVFQVGGGISDGWDPATVAEVQ